MGITTLRCYAFGARAEEMEAWGAWVRLAGRYRSDRYRKTDEVKPDTILMFCAQGGGRFTLAGENYELSAGTVFCVPAGSHYSCVADEEQGWDLWWIRFQGEVATRFAAAAGFSVDTPHLHLPTWTDGLPLFQQLFHLLEQKPLACHYDATRLLLQLLIELKKARSHHAQRLDGAFQGLHYRLESLDELVAQSGYSKFHFIRLFKQAMGMTPWQYVLQLKIDKAKAMLMGSEDSIKSIAVEVGFSNPLYFSRLFRKMLGVSPSVWREQNRT